MNIPYPEARGYSGNLGLLFAERAESTRAAVVELVDDEPPRVTTFRELNAACDAFARAMVGAGFRAGDRIAVLSRNNVQFIIALLGAMRAGVVAVPINIKLAPDTVLYILADAAVRLVFAEPTFRFLIPDGLDSVFFGRDADGFGGFLDYGSFQSIEPAPDTVAIQPYTSGSTGMPKGVLLTHYGQNWSRRILAHTRGTTERDVILVAAPLYHKNALNAVKQGLTAGASLRLLRQFSVERYIEAIGHHQCTVVSGVPTMIAMVLARKDLLMKTDTLSVRTVMMGSAASSPQLLEEIKTHFTNAESLVVYGVTEGGPVPLGPHPDGKPRSPGSIGMPYAGTEARLVGGIDENEGELVLKNPGIMLGYHNLPKETAERVRDGWYYTGDVCRRDREGFYYFVGRIDDMFKCGGEAIFPLAVETLIERHPAVSQALVMPFDHKIKGEVPYAFVVLRQGATATEDDLKQFTLANGPAYQHPRRVFFLHQLPLAGTNKVDKQLLRAWVADGTLT
jgi:acyl-CoA synthetase (AMP-forming)/AMP-acid ligase II